MDVSRTKKAEFFLMSGQCTVQRAAKSAQIGLWTRASAMLRPTGPSLASQASIKPGLPDIYLWVTSAHLYGYHFTQNFLHFAKSILALSVYLDSEKLWLFFMASFTEGQKEM